MRSALLVWLVVVVTGCQSAPPRDPESFAAHTIGQGGSLILLGPLTVPAYQSSIYFQGGRAVDYIEVNQHYPHCRLELWTVDDHPQIVNPDRFAIHDVARNLEFAHMALPASQPLAALEMPALYSGMPLREVRAVSLYLDSRQQRDVYRLTCRHWVEVREARDLTVRDVRRILAGVFTLQLR